MNLKRYVLANPEAKLPMPDRGGRLFRASGETVDADSAFWAARVADGELVEVAVQTPPHRISSASRAAPSAARTGPPAGRGKAGGSRSGPRPSADADEIE